MRPTAALLLCGLLGACAATPPAAPPGEARIAAVQPGMDAAQVEKLLGAPGG